jgi:signal transduction histidine kinase
MRILPRSLFGRLCLVLLAGLLAAQLLSAYILLRERGQTLYQSIRGDLVERTAGIIRLLDALQPEERDRLLPLFNTRQARIRFAHAPADIPAEDIGASATARAIQGALQNLLPPGSEVRVALEEELAESDLPATMAGMHRRHMRRRGGMAGPWAYLHGVHAQARGFFIQTRLTDGTWVQFDRRIPEDLFSQPTRLLMTLAVLLVSVALLSLLAVRWAVRPLHALRLAAEELGRDINRPPLAETGPAEVVDTARAFNTMQHRIQNFIEDRTRILAAVSHDLKTPLTRLRLRTDLLNDDQLRTKLHTDLDDMESMVGATLDFMRGTESQETSQRLDLMAMLETIMEDARDAGWDVALTGQVTRPIQGRPTAIKRCITNLVENAARYGGSADVLATEESARVRISIQDRGPGIPEELLEKVFDPFFRIESSRARHTGGTGLGLGVARNIARGHGGDLVLQNRIEGGLRAELILPR